MNTTPARPKPRRPAVIGPRLTDAARAARLEQLGRYYESLGLVGKQLGGVSGRSGGAASTTAKA